MEAGASIVDAHARARTGLGSTIQHAADTHFSSQQTREVARLGVPFAGSSEAEPGAVAKPQSARAASSIALSWEDGCGTRARM
jgi:hypothetical protein